MKPVYENITGLLWKTWWYFLYLPQVPLVTYTILYRICDLFFVILTLLWLCNLWPTDLQWCHLYMTFDLLTWYCNSSFSSATSSLCRRNSSFSTFTSSCASPCGLSKLHNIIQFVINTFTVKILQYFTKQTVWPPLFNRLLSKRITIQPEIQNLPRLLQSPVKSKEIWS